MKKVDTTKIQGGAMYAKVSDRLKAFRSDNPRALIETTPIPQENGMIMFKARIVKDKAEEHSAEATGHSLQIKGGTKDFEKLETVAVGRALALLGYTVDGEIASSEEMEEYEEYKKQKKDEAKQIAIEALEACNTLNELKTTYASLGAFQGDKEVIAVKDKLKAKLA